MRLMHGIELVKVPGSMLMVTVLRQVWMIFTAPIIE